MSYLEQSRQAHLSMNSLRKEIEELEKEQGLAAEYYSGDYGDVCEDYPDCDGSCNGACQACLYCGSDQGDKCKCTVTLVPYGYGIVDRDGNPYDEDSLWFQEEGAKVVARIVNDCSIIDCDCHKDELRPYRVVRLLYQEMEDEHQR